MLTPGIHQAYCAGVAALARHGEVTDHRSWLGGAPSTRARPGYSRPRRRPSSPIPNCRRRFRRRWPCRARAAAPRSCGAVVEALEGQLTTAVHFAASDTGAAGRRCCLCSKARPAASWPMVSAPAWEGVTCHGPWRTLSCDLGWPLDLRRAPSLSAVSCGRSATRTSRTRVLPEELREGNPLGFWRQDRWRAGQGLGEASDSPAHKRVLASASASCRSKVTSSALSCRASQR